MTVKVSADCLGNLEAKMRFGRLVRLVRRFRVRNLVDTDYKVLLSAIVAGGVPAPGAPLTNAPNLVVTDHDVRLVLEDPHVADVDVTYETADSEGQNLDNPPFGVIACEVSTTIAQTTSNLDIDGNTVELQHTYPDDDPNFPGETIKQGGEFSVFQAQSELKIPGIKHTSTPWLLERTIKNTTNRSAWQGGEPGTWMCTSIERKLADVSGPRFFMTFVFQYNPDGWDPQIRFVDSVTGKPPTGLVDGVGYKTVRKYQQVDFEAIIGARVQGG